MRLYHGTSEATAMKVLERGLMPRGRRRSRWKAASAPDRVYLTNAFAMHFAAAAAGKGNPAIVEIDTDRLDAASFFADEDALALAFGKGLLDPGPMVSRKLKIADIHEQAAHFAAELETWAESGADWQWSMSLLGNCTHKGTIPPEAITRIVVFRREGPWWQEWHDPVVSPDNFRFFGGYYRATNLVFVGRIEEASTIDLGFNTCDLDDMERKVAPKRTIVF